MKRLFWFTVGTAAGAYASHKVHQKVRTYTPTGIAEQATSVLQEAGRFIQDVRAATAERESELTEHVGLFGSSSQPVITDAPVTEVPPKSSRRNPFTR